MVRLKREIPLDAFRPKKFKIWCFVSHNFIIPSLTLKSKTQPRGFIHFFTAFLYFYVCGTPLKFRISDIFFFTPPNFTYGMYQDKEGGFSPPV